jgi:hypothetical protein
MEDIEHSLEEKEPVTTCELTDCELGVIREGLELVYKDRLRRQSQVEEKHKGQYKPELDMIGNLLDHKLRYRDDE